MKLRYAAVLALAALVAPFASTAEAKDVSLITDFGFNGRHAFFYVALDKGYYKDAGLDVTILRGQGSADAVKKVASGAATFGFADAGTLILARGNDKVPVKMVSVTYAAAPQAIFVLGDSGIKTPKDLEGKTIADTASSSVRLLFPAYAAAAGIDASKVNWVTADGASLASVLATKRADGIGQFSVGKPLVENVVAPNTVTVLSYKDAGLNLYSNGLIASDETIAKDPDMVRAFVAATLKGEEYAFAHPEEAGEIMHKYQKQIDPKVITGETEMVKDLATVPGQKLGAIDPARMADTVDVMAKYFTLNAPVDPKDVYAPGFVE